MEFDHYIGMDWSQATMAIARLTSKSQQARVDEFSSDLKFLKEYLKGLKGRKILTFEESTPAQWLYSELRNCVDELLVCDPSRNALLSEGAKNDKIDAEKLVRLLRAGMLKPVFHSVDGAFELRKLVSTYEDIVRAGARFKNQKNAFHKRLGSSVEQKSSIDEFVLRSLDQEIDSYQKHKAEYEEQFSRQANKHSEIRFLSSIPGIGLINAVKVFAVVVDARRFPTRNHFLSYCGLVGLQMMSGGKSYGSKRPRYSRTLKSVFKTAAMVCIHPHNNTPLKDYYEKLILEKRYSEHIARHALARRIAVLTWGVLKTKKHFQWGEYRKCKHLIAENVNQLS